MKGAGPPEQYGVLADQHILTQVVIPLCVSRINSTFHTLFR